ncbi:MAG TPA: NAD(P)-dependent oxidoreductase [Acidobacteriaceae bacterium]
MKVVVLFGGTGFIGTHLAQRFLSDSSLEKIYLVDHRAPRTASYAGALNHALSSGRAVFVPHDVRKPVPLGLLPPAPGLVFNLAAVHREPGHAASEYFETNLRGAENVCAWTSAAGCRTMVFTSSISPYGPSEDKKTETSLPTPETAYGSSKLAAEKIHLAWQGAQPERKLLILRPGVVFGPGEGGNVTRLLRSLVKGYFVYLGNRNTVKAAGYVKELCAVAMFGLDVLRKGDEPNLLLNFTMDPPPTVEQMVNAIVKTMGKERNPLSVPSWVMLALSYPMSVAESATGIKLPINRVRVRKLIRSNNIWAEGLRALGYQYRYTLESAFEDWKRDCPEDFS